ncbi:uncharacterized protein HMPREF1541_03826 [Cyphellophora europaea CBS 101466]|uniref:Uncharacterized protein n=1 Tax=Cyphellophora europaea (strain CBS 101466) TaxID=1220924 RepID=W2RZP6_CYPE1|nr:uncharacterized protein HMPREF1541_03826 [Cyphellophora europaea CBS 101466]ETN41887.1 hypothetical protein HMPREF1541_03826 [Cyphellophora europaea CBS 101466]
MPYIHFLPTKKLKEAITNRERELISAEARSHAATIAHRRRTSPVGGGCALRTSHAIVKKKRFSKSPVLRQEPQKQPQRLVAGLAWIKTGKLDPFLQLPCELGPQDRRLLYFYLSFAPVMEYGLKANPVFCPVRDYGIPQISRDPTFLSLYLLIAEMATRAPITAIYARRASIYNSLRKLIDDPHSGNLDTTLILLAGTGSAENRLGNVDLAQKHYAAAMQLVNMRGGLRTLHQMPFVGGLGIVRCFLQQDICLFSDWHTMSQALDRMTLTKGSRIDSRLWKYLSRQTQPRLCLANLHMLNMVMANEPDGFHDELLRLTLGSGDRLTPSALQFIISTCVARVGRWHGLRPALRSWETIEFVGLVGYAAPGWHQALVETMSGWLMGDEPLSVDWLALKHSIQSGYERAQSEVGSPVEP